MNSFPNLKKDTGSLDKDDEDEENKLSVPDANDDYTTLRPCRQQLNLDTDYVDDWTKANAFREFCQNWMDAMIHKKGVTRERLQYLHKGMNNEYRITVQHPTSKKPLGYLLFDKKKGMLELCNFGSQMPRRVLRLGGTSKKKDEKMAGTHGEGFKLAALLMVRHGHQTKYTASGFYWNFRWGVHDKDTLWCFLSKVRKNAKLSQQSQTSSQNPTQAPKNDPWGDVSVKIGNVYGRGATGITEDEFKAWLKVCLHFDRPADIIETQYGTLILQDEFRGKIYLKGLLLERMTDGKRLRYLLAKIWNAAIEKERGDKILDLYLDMLEDNGDDWTDVSNIKDYMTQFVATRIWKGILERASNKSLFYHGQQNATEDAMVIRSSFKKIPILLPDAIWKPIRKWRLARSPSEHKDLKMRNAATAVMTDTPYSASLQRTLRAALSLDKRTNMNIVFKKAGENGLDVYVNKDAGKFELYVHERFLNFNESHKEEDIQCELARTQHIRKSVDAFTCDHIINDLYEQLLWELDRYSAITFHGNETQVSVFKTLRSKVDECLRNMPGKIEVSQGSNSGELRVSWVDTERDRVSDLHGIQLQCLVKLHRESTCSHRRFDLLASPSTDKSKPSSNGALSEGMLSRCECPEHLTSNNNVVIFKGLDLAEQYFPMVSRAYTPAAFYGFPPNAQTASKTTQGCSVVPTDVERLQQQLQAKELELASTRTQLQDVRSQLNTRQAELGAAKLRQAVLEKENSQKGEQLRDLQQKARTLELTLEKAQHGVNRIRKAYREEQSLHQGVKDDLNLRDFQLRTAQQKLDIETLRFAQDLRTLKTKNDEKCQQTSQERSALNEAIAKLLNQKQELTRELETIRAETQSLVPAVGKPSHTTEDTQLEGTSVAVKDPVNEDHLQLEIQQLESDNDRLKSKQENLLSEAQAAVKRKDEAIAEAQVMKQEIAEAREAERRAIEREQAAVEGEQAAVKSLQKALERLSLVMDDKNSNKRRSSSSFRGGNARRLRSPKRVKVEPENVIVLD